jgi:hypothetical protein
MLWPTGIFYNYLVNFIQFIMLYTEKSGNPALIGTGTKPQILTWTWSGAAGSFFPVFHLRALGVSRLGSPLQKPGSVLGASATGDGAVAPGSELSIGAFDFHRVVHIFYTHGFLKILINFQDH